MEIPQLAVIVLALQAQLLPSSAWTPHSPEQFRRFEELCMDLAEVPVRQRALLREHLYPDEHRTHCFHRCLGIVSGLYSDREGADLGRVYAQFGGGRNETQFRDGAERCFRWMLATEMGEGGSGIRLGKCERPYRMHQCFAKVYREQFEGL
ncbi:uncharacterized protein LOC120420270 [Culex pipiens pallens]|uniref:uncharacterized protein LOC120420270 n=1 Tax=Culex pipiens pallens TaxID=42434 RepID=UPI001952EC74|nr:uncharacterized protein LOC120420270 [Culex pipiens pallens]